MLSAAELKYQRANTAAFIGSNPTRIVLIPRIKTKDGAGTRWTDQPPRLQQTFKLIDQSSSFGPTPGLIRTSDGVERLMDFILIGAHDSAVALWDYWTDANGVWEIAQLFPPNQYELRAAVVRHA